MIDTGGSPDWIWREDQISDLLGRDSDEVLFVSGCKSNQGKFYDRFDAVVLLSAPEQVILERIADRDTNTYGKSETERDLVLKHLRNVEPLLRQTATAEIDTTHPLTEVADELVRIASES